MSHTLTTHATEARSVPPLAARHDPSFLIETKGLSKRFGSRIAVDQVDLVVPRGCAFGYLGPNGAGKTTLIRMLLGLTGATSGTMRLRGYDVPAHRAEALSRVGAIVEEPRFHGHLTGRENLEIVAAVIGPDAGRRIDSALERVGLVARAHERVKTYSMGMRQRLGVARCLLNDPELLMLDEPLNGLDPAGILEFRTMVRALVDEGRTVVISSHLLDEIEKTCDVVAIVDRGRVVRQGPVSELVSDEEPWLIVDCDNPTSAAAVLTGNPQVRIVTPMPDGSLRLDLVHACAAAGINRALVEAGVAVSRLEPVRITLEERFLEITSRMQEEI